ncbi:hypothetical protein [Paraburkholderia sp.]|nr:hypothetical protein [Paraburkholderia sp.]MDE1180696.1 hypothetical protein [Paraburkholderia sp.]
MAEVASWIDTDADAIAVPEKIPTARERFNRFGNAGTGFPVTLPPTSKC